MRDAELRALERSEDDEAQVRRRREEWRRDSLGAERLEVAALLGSELAAELSQTAPVETPHQLLRALIAVGPGARLRTVYCALRVVAPLWEVLRHDERSRRLLELAGRVVAGEADLAGAARAQAEGFEFLSRREVPARLVARAFAAGTAAILAPGRPGEEGQSGEAFSALGWSAAALARLPQHERALIRGRPGADLPLGVARALRGQPRRTRTRDAYAPAARVIPGPLGSSRPADEPERLPRSPWRAGEGGVETLALAIARQLGPWCLDGVEPVGVAWGPE